MPVNKMSAHHHRPGSVTYPQMERQDLTQAQLGSFKFTPSDGIGSQDFTYHPPRGFPHPLLEQQWEETKRKIQQLEQAKRDQARLAQQIVSEDGYVHDSPALSIGGPHRDNRIRSPAGVGFSEASQMRGDMTIAAESNILDHSRGLPTASTPNPNASEFFPGVAHHCDRSILIQALATEQQAHQACRQELVQAQARLIGLEAKLKHVEDHNRSLVGSVNMLKSVVQHNVRQDLARNASDKDSAQRPDAVRGNLQTRDDGNEQTLLYDVAESYREATQARNQITEERSQHQDTNFWDLDALENTRNRSKASDTQALPVTRESKPKCQQLIDVMPESSETIQTITSTQTQVTIAPAEVPATWTYRDRRSSSSTTVSSIAASSIEKVLDEEKQEDQEQRSSVYMAMPFDVTIHWKTTSHNPIFESEIDKYNHLGPGFKLENQQGCFYDYPVRYTPSKGVKNLYRTIMIDFLPPDTDYFSVLEVIRGGSIESVRLYDPLPNIGRFKTARVIFNYELSANTVYLRGQNPGIYVKGERVRAWQVLQPTYPRNKKLESDIFDRGCTRLLIMEDASRESVSQLPQKLNRFIRAGSLIEIGQTYDGLPIIEFTSVDQAIQGMEQLMNDPDFSGASFDFEADQCEEPYAEATN